MHTVFLLRFYRICTLSLLLGILFFNKPLMAQTQAADNKSINLEVQDIAKGMYLNLPDSAFDKIKRKRAAAMEKKRLFKQKGDYVYGTLKSNGKEIKLKARLKGDHPDHFDTNDWSFRIVAENGTILNHRKISVQSEHTRGYASELAFHKLLAYADIVHLQYEFFPFCVNDSLCGIYALESHFDNYLLEMAGRKNGPILKFDEDKFWDFEFYKDKKNRDDLIMTEAPIELCNKKWGAKKENKKLCKKAIKMLHKFRKGKLATSNVFDLEIWAKFMVVNEFMRSDHALRWHNLRFYYNPETKKIEPIGFDCGTWFPKTKDIYYKSNGVELFHRLMLKLSTLIKYPKKILFSDGTFMFRRNL